MKHWILGSALAVVLVIGLPGAALAHAGSASSSPEPGQTLGTTPGQVTLTFSEPLNTELSRVTVLTPDGSSIAGRVVGADGMVVDLTTSQPGVYQVNWTTVSVVDGHTLSGSFAFGVGVSPGTGSQSSTTDEPTGYDLLITVGRLVEDTSLLLLLGLLLLGGLSRREPALTWVRTPTLLVFATAFIGGLWVVLGEALRATGSLDVGAMIGYLTTGSPGWARSVRVLAEGIGVLAAWRWPLGQAPFAIAAIMALAASGHAAAVTWGIPVEAVHLLSAGIWVGGIMALAIQRPAGGLLGDEGRRLLDRFTPVALAGFTVTIGTGVIRAIQEVGDWAGLFGSSYGLVLLAKVAFVLLMLQLSVLAWRRIAVFRNTESALAILVIAAGALLSAFPLPPTRQVDKAQAAEPAAVPSAAPAIPAGGAVTLGGHAGSILVGLTVSPGKRGPNELTVYVQSLDGASATAGLPVDATVKGSSIALTQCGDTCRKGRVTLRGGELVAVDVGTAAGGRAIFRLPTLPAPPGDQALQRALTAMSALTSYRLTEDLTSGLGTSVHTTYAFTAPNSFESHTVEQGSSFTTVWLGDTRYTRQDDGPWTTERGVPAVPVPTYIWDSFRPYRDTRIVGTSVVDGVQTTELAFAGGDQQLPIWFELWVGTDGLVRRAEMRAPGHFMDHRYYDFDAPITIEPPKGASR